MDIRYQEWIRANVPTECFGLCGSMSRRMCDEFPELTFVEGRYYKIDELEKYDYGHGHCWCVTKTGEIVDPTVAQFNDGGQGRYITKTEIECSF